MQFIPLSFLAGLLTILAPCVLPVLPIIIGGSLKDRNPWRPFIITMSLAGSIVLFTLLLKATTAFIDIPDIFWKIFSGGIILFFALSLLFPKQWTWISEKIGFEQSSQKLLAESGQKPGVAGMIFMGAALGPVFASCSPTYFLILGTVLPQNFFVGLINLIVYGLGLALVLFAIAYAGQQFLGKIRSLANPNGWFKKMLGVLFLLVGVAILFGWDKQFEAFVLDQVGYSVIEFEQNLLDHVQGR